MFLTMFLGVLIVSVFGVQLVHVDLLRLAPHNEHLGKLVLDDVLVGVECRRLRRSASSRRSSQACPSR